MSTTDTRDAAQDAGPGVEPGAPEWHRGWAKVAIALVLAGQGMAFSLAVNISDDLAGTAYWVVHGGLAASALAVLALLGGPLLRECVATLRAGRITVDLLFLVTLTGAFAVSVFSTFRREGPVFYELVGILLAIYTTGKLLGARSRSRALRAVEELRAEHATCVVQSVGGARTRVPVETVKAGDRVFVAPGEAVAIDGVVRVGVGLVETTPLTGEPQPAIFEPGGSLLAGMRSVDGAFEIEVTAAAGRRRLDGVLQVLEQARLRPSRLQFEADRLAASFVPLVLLVSAATFGLWAWRGGLAPAIVNSLAVLVVACPCALGLATPLGIWAGLVGLGRLGIVARSGDFLEALAQADVAVFDKTGTICDAEMRVQALSVLETSPLPEGALRAVLATAEAPVDHPVARALHRAVAGAVAPGSGYTLVEARVVPGRGLRAKVRDTSDGWVHEIVAGVPALLVESGVKPPVGTTGAAAETGGLRRIEVAVDGIPAAVVQFAEQERAQSASVFTELRSLGLVVEILTGDPAFPASRWPDVRRWTGVTAEQKAEHVSAHQREGRRVLFVGDGLNDATALAAADAPLAVREGADLARSNAMAVVGGDSLGTLPAAVRLARGVRDAIRSNLRFAAIYNTLGMAIAAAGWLHPVLAALLMAGSSAIVSARVLRVAGR